jgi:CubicO group peptidase (beta-lactamase class C family)
MPASTDRFAAAWKLIERWSAEGRCPAVGAVVGSSRGQSEPHVYGRQSPTADAPVRPDAIFLIASPTKPVTALAIMLLVERGEVRLSDPVCRYVPEFTGEGKESVTLAHCLTHTSGLPDMPPSNAELRARRAPLDDFLRATLDVKLDFFPGTGFQYQSMGSLMLAEVLHQAIGRRLPDFLREEVFEPLEMRDTALGMPADWERSNTGVTRADRIAEVRLPDDAHGGVWNTAYWRKLGVPWGGLLSTPADLGRLCRHLLQIHAGKEGLFSPATVAAMSQNQLATMPKVPESVRRCQPWGYGWRLNWPNHTDTFGDLLSPAAYGHWGATGTMVWIDPARDAFAVVLTTQPLDLATSRMACFSNAVCAALPPSGAA